MREKSTALHTVPVCGDDNVNNKSISFTEEQLSDAKSSNVRVSETERLSDTESSNARVSETEQLSDAVNGAAQLSKGVKKERKTAKKGRKSKKTDEAEKLTPLKTAAENIADMLSSLSEDTELFVVSQDEKPSRRLDTKTLKEFSSVIKEITGVICELNGISVGKDSEGTGAVKIEFDEEAEACSH